MSLKPTVTLPAALVACACCFVFGIAVRSAWSFGESDRRLTETEREAQAVARAREACEAPSVFRRKLLAPSALSTVDAYECIDDAVIREERAYVARMAEDDRRDDEAAARAIEAHAAEDSAAREAEALARAERARTTAMADVIVRARMLANATYEDVLVHDTNLANTIADLDGLPAAFQASIYDFAAVRDALERKRTRIASAAERARGGH